MKYLIVAITTAVLFLAMGLTYVAGARGRYYGVAALAVVLAIAVVILSFLVSQTGVIR